MLSVRIWLTADGERGCLRTKPKKEGRRTEIERDRLPKTLLELLDPAMPEVHVTGVTCHLHKLTLVVFSSSETKKIKTEKESLKLPDVQGRSPSYHCLAAVV